jgi:hypothetical protein
MTRLFQVMGFSRSSLIFSVAFRIQTSSRFSHCLSIELAETRLLLFAWSDGHDLTVKSCLSSLHSYDATLTKSQIQKSHIG